jgi:transcription termination/antitermination protein NusA
VGNALSPAKVVSVTVLDARSRTARVVVPDFQLSLAIGKEGQNARLAARLTGWRIDIRSDADPRVTGAGPASHTGAGPASHTGAGEASGEGAGGAPATEPAGAAWTPGTESR